MGSKITFVVLRKLYEMCKVGAKERKCVWCLVGIFIPQHTFSSVCEADESNENYPNKKQCDNDESEIETL